MYHLPVAMETGFTNFYGGFSKAFDLATQNYD